MMSLVFLGITTICIAPGKTPLLALKSARVLPKECPAYFIFAKSYCDGNFDSATRGSHSGPVLPPLLVPKIDGTNGIKKFASRTHVYVMRPAFLSDMRPGLFVICLAAASIFLPLNH